MSKSKEELEELKKEVEALNEKVRELTPEELEQVTGGILSTQISTSQIFEVDGVDPALNRWQRGNEDLDDDGMKPGIL